MDLAFAPTLPSKQVTRTWGRTIWVTISVSKMAGFVAALRPGCEDLVLEYAADCATKLAHCPARLPQGKEAP